MRRFATLTLIAPVLAGLVFLPGCGSEEKKEVSESRPRSTGKKSKEKAVELEAPTDGTIKGRVVLSGAAPKVDSLVPQMEKNQDSKICLSGKDFEKQEQSWILASDGKGVANVVVRLVPPSGKAFKTVAPDKKEVEIDQPHCAFVPHVVAVKKGQVLKVLNSAPVPHNTKAVGQPGENEEKNVVVPPGDPGKIFELNPQKEPVSISCQIHPWMSAKVYVADHIYIATTDGDGNFELKNVPTGVELEIQGVHGAGSVKGDKVTLKGGETKTVDLQISAK